MARPQKEGLDYFSLDVDMDQDDKIALVEAKHKIIGFAIVVKLLMKIYKEGYFYRWTEREQLLFSSKINVDTNTISEVINDCLKWEFFDSRLYQSYQILTSKGIQRRYLEAVKRRKELNLIQEYLLVETPESTESVTVNIVNVVNNRVNVDINPNEESLLSASIPKEKKSKVNQTKEIIYTPDESEILSLWNSKGIIRHSESEKLKKEIDKALKSFGKEQTFLAIEHYSEVLHSDFYYNHKFTLENFLKREKGLPKFIDNGEIWVNYTSRNKTNNGVRKGEKHSGNRERWEDDPYIQAMYGSSGKSND